MELIEEIMGDVVVEIVNSDRATINESHELREALQRKIDAGYNKIIIDLSACEFVDSTFLGVLVSNLKKVVKEGGDLKLVGFKPVVRSMFELTRMFRVFASFSDLQEAIRSFR
jgi:anti-anti-sigma factor